MIVNIEPGKRLSTEYLAHLNKTVNAPENPIIYLGIDPGKSNGVCGYDEKFYLQFMLTIQADDMVMFLEQFHKIKVCVVEVYRVFPNKLRSHIYSNLETPRVIGRIEGWAARNQFYLEGQPSHIKSTGYKWIGQKPLPKSNPRNHEWDAHVHFMYWAIRTGRIKLESLLR